MIDVTEVAAALELIRTHADKWPSPSELRANARGLDAAATRSTPAPGQLPYGLDRTVNTPVRTRTREGAAAKLAGIAAAWDRALAGVATPGTRDYEAAAARCVELLPRAWQDLPPATWQDYAQRLIRLAKDTRTQCATGAHGTAIRCPNCPQAMLVRPYTDAGISDNYTCPQCAGEWDAGELQTLALAHSTYIRSVTVTRAEAAALLGISWEGIQARVKRRALTPVEGQGRGAKYVLRDLQ